MKNSYGRFLLVFTLFFTYFFFFSLIQIRFKRRIFEKLKWKCFERRRRRKKTKETLSECANISSKNQNWKILCKNCAPKVLNSFLWFISRMKLVHKKLINQIKKHYLQIFAENGVKTKECRSVQLRYIYVSIVHRHTFRQTQTYSHIISQCNAVHCSPNVTWQTTLNWWRIVMIHGKILKRRTWKWNGIQQKADNYTARHTTESGWKSFSISSNKHHY